MGHWLQGHDDIREGALWHGDGLGMVRALATACTPIQLLFGSPPYNVGKSYESPMPYGDYVAWQREVLTGCVSHLAPGGSVIWQVGMWIDPQGGVHPLDMPIFTILTELGLKPRNRIVWTVGHGLHATHRLSGRHETLVWFQRPSDAGAYPFYLDDVRVPQRYPAKRHYKGPHKGELSCHPLGKNPGDTWDDIPQVKASHVERTGHPAQMPLALAERAILMTTREGDLVVDPFAGACTTVVAARMHNRLAAGADLKDEYLALGARRLEQLRDGTLPHRPAGKPKVPNGRPRAAA